LIEIPILPALAQAIEAMPGSKSFTFLTTDAGLPFTAAGFGNWFRECCKAAGLPSGYAAHGLRKAAATHHANQGATAHELMAWFGWKTLKEAERYTRSANRKALAQGMVAKLQKGTTSGNPQ
jgi:integrase